MNRIRNLPKHTTELLPVLVKLDLTELLNLAQMNQNLSALVADAFERKYAEKTFIIKSFGKEKKDSKRRIFENDNVVIEDIELSFSTLKHFGEYIFNLELHFDGENETNFYKILSAVNEHCSESLIKLRLLLNQPIVLPRLSKQFNKVKYVSIENHLPLISSHTHRMNQTYPELQSLSVSVLTADSDYVSCQFSQLEHLRVSTADENMIADLLIRNPHIKSISVQRGTLDLMLMIKETLPSLQHLSIGWFDMQNEEIRLDNVTKFTMELTSDSPKNFFFSNLQEIDMYFHSTFFNEWMEFFERHQQITKFHLRHWSISDDQFEKLTSFLPNLVEMTTSSLQNNTIKSDTISQFIESHRKLNKFELDSCEEAEKREFLMKFENNWKIQDYRQCASFQRRH